MHAKTSADDDAESVEDHSGHFIQGGSPTGLVPKFSNATADAR